MAKTTSERIENIQEEIRQLENQRKQLQQRQKEEERKARTHRLIEHGAVVEKVIIGAKDMSKEALEAFLLQVFPQMATLATQAELTAEAEGEPK